MRYFIHGEEITAAEAETINAENRIILAEAAAGNFAALLKLITVTTVKKGGF